jgi:hypothetical protein
MYLIVLVFGGTYLIQESSFIFQVLDIEASSFLSGFDISINGNLFIHSDGSISFPEPAILGKEHEALG